MTTLVHQIFFTLVVSWLWFQGHCQDVIQHPKISWSFVSKSAEMNCTHKKDASHTQMYWYIQRPGQTMTLIVYAAFDVKPDFGGGPESKYSVNRANIQSGALTVKELAPEDSGVYFCSVSKHSDGRTYFGKGTKLTVLEKDRSVTPPTVKVIRPSPRECTNQKDKGKKKTIVCVASGFYPDHVSVLWKIDGENVTNNVATDEDAKMVGDFYRITSRLRVSREDYYSNPKKEFTCEVSFFNKTHTTYHSDGISSDEDKQTVTMTREKYLSITQSAKLSYGVLIVKSCVYGAFVCFLVWKLQGSGKPIK
ncbi:M1-specific T cell receptor beta chain-like isoform 4-T4 [Pholidichthys leucotaenia]